tara:strand:- start:4373 stop:4972 length:600 start_codon:yes stop_codon:yes gene_type:complete
MINSKILKFIEKLNTNNLQNIKKKKIDSLIQLIGNTDQAIKLNYICTHNSRRSQLSQIWSETLSVYFNKKNIFSFSGGTQVTEVYEGLILLLEQVGFNITKESKVINSTLSIDYGDPNNKIKIYSKLFNCNSNPKTNFIAIINCESADKNCPIVHGAEYKFFLPFKDPKLMDGTNNENIYYSKTNMEIASTLKYLFENI